MRAMIARYCLVVFALAALLGVGLPLTARAETADRLATLDILVWPEFDDPRVLVQYDGQLAAQDNYPRTISFFIPSGAELSATAYVGADNKLLNTDAPQVSDAGNGYQRVTFNLPAPHYHLEYYHDAIQGAPDKTLDFVYKAALPADKVQLEIQQPLRSEKFATNPPAAQQTEGAHAFKYHIFQYPALAADQELKVQVTYSKADPNPSVQNVVVTEEAPAADMSSSANTWMIAGIAGAIGIGLVLAWMWWTRRQQVPTFAGARAAGQGKRRKGSEPAGGFCGQCGAPIRANDRFCSNCGARRGN